MAVDPGVNFGIAVIDRSEVFIYYGALAEHVTHNEHGILAHDLVVDLIAHHDFDSSSTYVLEGAAFNKSFGQVGLAEVRQGYYMGLRMYANPFDLVPPMTARKVVFGDGRMQAGDVWPTLNHNGADALCLALYGLHQ